MANIVVGIAAFPLPLSKSSSLTFTCKTKNQELHLNCSQTNHSTTQFPCSLSSISSSLGNKGSCIALACLPRPSQSSSSPTRLYVSGLSFRTTEESLRNAFKNFGQLEDVNLVMDKIANRPRGFAFLRYATEEESQKAIERMHGKFLDGRVIFVEVAKPRSDLRQKFKQNTGQ